jgi:molecular chaperone HscA
MLRASVGHADADMRLRMLREAQVDARRLLDATESALALDGQALLSPTERAAVQQAMNAVAEALETEAPADAVKAACEALNEATTDFAGRRMNAGIQRALTGRALEALG